MATNIIATTLKKLRKEHGMTQVDLATKSGVGLNFIRELEQGKATVRMDKVTQVFSLFDFELVPVKKEVINEESAY
jgi:y4mF family transcriptional regulator